ncbi:MAG TPA: uracil-DNA glycosylase family protein [Bdellovibrionota bacterium]|nr:uracil-DNA glycosylase family protein [Bdellovibrionota bacterium]
MKNRDWIEFLDTLGHDPDLVLAATLPAENVHPSASARPAVPFVFVGEDLSSGPSADLLGKMIAAMGLGARQSRILDLSEVSHLSEHSPQWIITLGERATSAVFEGPTSVEENRGRLHHLAVGKVMPTYHPSELLQQPEKKKPCWEDLQLIMQDAGLRR